MSRTPNPKFKRTKYLVSTKFQLRYVGIILSLMFVTGIICSYAVYYTVMVLMGDKLSSVYPQGRLIAIIDTVNIRMMLSLLFIMPIVVMIGVYLSHKIAGPIYRIEQFLGGMASGNFASRIFLRKGDEFTSVADKINVLNDSLKIAFVGQKSSMDRIIGELEAFKKIVDSKCNDAAQLDNGITRLQREIRDLEGQLAKFKI